MQAPRRAVCRFQALLAAARLLNVSKVVAVWTQCSLDSHTHVLNHDGTAFAEQRRALEEVLYRKNVATIQAQRHNLVVDKAQITDSLEVVPASRAVACEVLVAFD